MSRPPCARSSSSPPMVCIKVGAGLRRTQAPPGTTPVTAGYNPGIRPRPARPQPTPEPRLAPTPTLTRALALLAVSGVALTALGPGSASASSHREAPLIAADPAVDNTDVYAFVSPERAGYVTFLANFIPFEEPNGGPNFYPFATDATYNINVDNDGDGKADAVFRYTFQTQDRRGNNTFLYNNGPVTSLDDENLLFRQTYTLESSFHGGPFK